MRDRTTFVFPLGQVEIPFRYDHGLILLDGHVGSRVLTVELGSCTWPNSVRADLVSEERWPRGGRVKSDGIGGRQITEEAEVPRLQLGDNFVMENLFCLTDPLGGPARPDLMIGARLFRDLAVRVNYPARHICFTPLAHARPPAASDHCLRFSMEMIKGVLPALTGDIRLDGRVEAREVLLDTGNNGSVLVARDLAEELGIRPGAPGVTTVRAGGYGGEANLLSRTVPVLSIGSIDLENVTVFAPEKQVGGIFDRPGWINLGNAVLEHFTVTWNTRHNAIWLEC